MGSSRLVLGFALTSIVIAPACSNLIGLGDYGVAGTGGKAESAGEAGENGEAGREDGGTSAGGASSGAGGAVAGAGAMPVAGTGGSVAGGAGAPGCTSDCDDGNACTEDSCVNAECKHMALAAGDRCAVGRICDEQAVCVRCRNTAPDNQQDDGCLPAAPVCSGTGEQAKCVEQCTVSDVALITSATTKGNGSFELPGTTEQSAASWVDESPTYYLIYDNADGPFDGATGSTSVKSGNGNYLAWLGGPVDAGVTSLTTTTTLQIPPGATTLSLLIDTNFQTKNVAATNKDVFEVRLLDGDTGAVIGAPLFAATPANAQTGSAHVWTTNGVNVSADVSASAGKAIKLQLWASADTADVTDFFLDNVRVSVTACQ